MRSIVTDGAEAWPPTPIPAEQLADALRSDFAPVPSADEEHIIASPFAHPLDLAIAGAHPKLAPDVVEQRYRSAGAEEIESETWLKLKLASITPTFKGIIAREMRRAYAEERKVSDDFSPDKLGLTTGPGIFDATQAREIEAGYIQRQMHEIMTHHIVVSEGENGEFEETSVLHPQEYSRNMQDLSWWIDDYTRHYERLPFLDEVNTQLFSIATTINNGLARKASWMDR